MQPIKQTKKGNPEKYGDYAYGVCYRSITDNTPVKVVKVPTSQAHDFQVLDTKKNRDTLEKFLQDVHGTREEIILSLSLVMDATPHKFCMGNIGKPTILGDGDKVRFNLQSVHMVAGAPTVEINLMGFENVKCAVFTSAKQLRETILDNFLKKVGEEHADFRTSVKEYFEGDDTRTVNWLPLVSDSAKQEFSKYLGELLIAIGLFENKINMTGYNPFAGKRITKFYVPLKDSFPMVDSIFYTQDKKFIPISSKSGGGAAPSFFTAVFTTILNNPSLVNTSNSYLKKMYEYAKGINMTSEATLKTKQLVYEIGVRDILKIPSTVIPKSYSVYEEFKKYDPGEYSTPVTVAYEALVREIDERQDRTSKLNIDNSTTVFFCKVIADNLQNDTKSMEIMHNVLGGKNFYQANIDLTRLKKGELHFALIKAGDAKIKITGRKSAYTDLDAKQGFVNFTLEKIG
jgi:hypothetical protein